MDKLVYTQHSVAWPRLPQDKNIQDEINVSLEADGGGTSGEMCWEFHVFDLKRHGILMRVFGDGLNCLFDPRVLNAVNLWRGLPDPDEITPDEFRELLEAVGVVPSKYHLQGVKESAP